MRSITKALLVAATGVLALRFVWLYVIPAWNTIATDFPNYYVSAWAVRHNDSLSKLYDPVWFEVEKHRAGIEGPAALFNYFPPMNALILWPLAGLSPIGAMRVWIVVNLAALAAVVALTVKTSGLAWLPSLLIALLGLDALGNNVAYGQFYIVLTLLMLIGVLSATRFPAVAGAATSIGAVTKIFPLFLLAYFAIRRNSRALLYAAAGIATLIIAGIFILGWAPNRVYVTEVLGRTLRGEIQDPYNVHWNTLQALLRRAFVREPTLNPIPIFDAPWLFFFVRPLVSVAVVLATLFAILRARRHNPLLEYGALIAMVSLITPSQASYHQFLFYPAIATGIARATRRETAFLLAGVFALICSNAMGRTAYLDSGFAMVFAFPRVYLVVGLWVFFLMALRAPRPTITRRMMFAFPAPLLVIFLVVAFAENRRWAADVADGATLVPLSSSSDLDIQPRFDGNRLITSSLGAGGFNSLAPETDFAYSPDRRWIVYATNVRGNWDIALRPNGPGDVRFLTTSLANDLTPSFSPDGKSVYFASDRHRGYRFTAIYRIDVDVR